MTQEGERIGALVLSHRVDGRDQRVGVDGGEVCERVLEAPRLNPHVHEIDGGDMAASRERESTVSCRDTKVLRSRFSRSFAQVASTRGQRNAARGR